MSIAPAEVVAEGVEFRRPESATGREPLMELSQRGGVEAVETPWTVDPDAHEPSFKQRFEMLGDIGLWISAGQ
jgi:hypothetical protein